jgi:hypothetical protein
MNRSNGLVSDLEAPTDQLVDEICQRLSSLYAMLDASLADVGPTVDDIRAHAGEVIRRLTGPNGQTTATLIARTMWPPQPGKQVPVLWWDTPLGKLIDDVTTGPGSTSAAER